MTFFALHWVSIVQRRINEAARQHNPRTIAVVVVLIWR
jgi:hypothetical protein